MLILHPGDSAIFTRGLSPVSRKGDSPHLLRIIAA